MVAPTLVIVPGFWLGTKPYEMLVSELNRVAPSLTDIVFAPLISTGTRSPNAPTMLDDANGIRAVIKPLVEAGKRVVVLAHSAGGFISAMSTADLEVGQKLAVAGGKGGVERFIFLAAGILPVGAAHPPTDWEVKDGAMWLQDLDEKLLFDVDAEVAEQHCKPFIKSQPPLTDWGVTCTYTGFDKAPSSYIVTEHDRVIPPAVQEMCAGVAGSDVVKISTGHMPMLSEPKLLAEKVISCMNLS